VFVVLFIQLAKLMHHVIKSVPLATEPGISVITGWLAGGPLLRVATIRRTTDIFLFVSHTTNVLPLKFRIIKEMPGSVATRTHCIIIYGLSGCAEFFHISS